MSTLTQGDIKTKIKAAILCQEQLVFTYDKDGTRVTRFAHPVELDDAGGVLCKQILPVDGIRNFKIDKIQEVRRVIARQEF